MYLVGGIIAAVLAGIHTFIQVACGAEKTEEKRDPAEGKFRGTANSH